MFKLVANLAGVLLVSSPVCAQVIDISIDGEAVVYTSTTVFENDSSGMVAERGRRSVETTSQRPLSLKASVARFEFEYGLPSGLVDAVIYQESRGRMDAVSPKGALGLMQLMPGTAAMLGVNPYDAVDNIRGGARYLRQQMDRFGSIPLALAAYNAGPGAVLRYGGIPPFRETQNYVTSILARWKPPSTSVPLTALNDDIFEPTNQENAFLIEVLEQ